MKEIFEHEYNLPERIWYGKGATKILSERLINWGISKVFLAIDPTVRITDFGRKLIDRIKKSSRLVLIWDQISTNVPRYQVEKATEQVILFKPDGLIAIGGGSTIDLAKSSLLLASSGKTLDDFWNGETIEGPFPPLFAIPTTCGTGSEANRYAVVLDHISKRKRGLNSKYLIPREAFLDVEALISLPSKIIAATALDAFCHAMESYVSSKGNSLTRSSCLGAIITISRYIREAVLNHNIDALDHLLSASTTARLLYSYTGLTVGHAMSHPIGAYFNMHHGEVIARTMLPALCFNTEVYPENYAEIARFIGVSSFNDSDIKSVDSLINWLENLLKDFDLAPKPIFKPDNYESIITSMAEDTLKSSNIPSNPRELDLESTKKLLYKII